MSFRPLPKGGTSPRVRLKKGEKSQLRCPPAAGRCPAEPLLGAALLGRWRAASPEPRGCWQALPRLGPPRPAAGRNAGMRGRLPQPPSPRRAGVRLRVPRMLRSWRVVANAGCPREPCRCAATSLLRACLHLPTPYVKKKKKENKKPPLAGPGTQLPGDAQLRGPSAIPLHQRLRPPCVHEAARPHRRGCRSRPVFFSSGGQLVSQMRALRCQGGFVTAPRAGPAALSCPPPPREPIVPSPSGGCWRQIYRGRRPAGRGLRSAAGRGAGGSAPGTFDPSCCHRRGRRGPRGRIPLGICFARPVRGWLLFFYFFHFFFMSPECFVRSCVGGARARAPPG